MKNPVEETLFSNFLFYTSRILLVLFIYLAFGYLIANAAVSVDSSSSQGAFAGGGVTNMTFSHSVGMGTSRALFVGVSTSNTTLGAFIGNRVTSVTFGGQPLTRIGSQISGNLNNGVEIFRLINPTSGAGTVEINLAALSSNYVFASAVSFSGVEQTTPNGAFFSATGNNDNPIVNVTDSASGDLVFDTVSSAFNAASFVQGLNQTVCTDAMDENTCRRGRRFFGGTSDVGASSIKNENGASVLMSWTLANPANWAIGAFAVKAVPSTAASGTIRGRVLSSEGKGIYGASVNITGSNGEIISARTNPFGYYRFNDIPYGETYILQVESKRFVFAPQVISFNEDMNDLNFVAVGK